MDNLKECLDREREAHGYTENALRELEVTVRAMMHRDDVAALNRPVKPVTTTTTPVGDVAERILATYSELQHFRTKGIDPKAADAMALTEAWAWESNQYIDAMCEQANCWGDLYAAVSALNRLAGGDCDRSCPSAANLEPSGAASAELWSAIAISWRDESMLRLGSIADAVRRDRAAATPCVRAPTGPVPRGQQTHRKMRRARNAERRTLDRNERKARRDAQRKAEKATWSMRPMRPARLSKSKRLRLEVETVNGVVRSWAQSLGADPRVLKDTPSQWAFVSQRLELLLALELRLCRVVPGGDDAEVDNRLMCHHEFDDVVSSQARYKKLDEVGRLTLEVRAAEEIVRGWAIALGCGSTVLATRNACFTFVRQWIDRIVSTEPREWLLLWRAILGDDYAVVPDGVCVSDRAIERLRDLETFVRQATSHRITYGQEIARLRVIVSCYQEHRCPFCRAKPWTPHDLTCAVGTLLAVCAASSHANDEPRSRLGESIRSLLTTLEETQHEAALVENEQRAWCREMVNRWDWMETQIMYCLDAGPSECCELQPILLGSPWDRIMSAVDNRFERVQEAWLSFRERMARGRLRWLTVPETEDPLAPPSQMDWPDEPPAVDDV